LDWTRHVAGRLGAHRHRRRRGPDHPVQGASGETFKTWSAMETIISVVSIVLILALGVVV
jgi:hypothetical protein